MSLIDYQGGAILFVTITCEDLVKRNEVRGAIVKMREHEEEAEDLRGVNLRCAAGAWGVRKLSSW